MGTVPVANLYCDGGNTMCLILYEYCLSLQRQGDGTVPDFFGRVCQGRKKAGTALAQSVYGMLVALDAPRAVPIFCLSFTVASNARVGIFIVETCG